MILSQPRHIQPARKVSLTSRARHWVRKDDPGGGHHDGKQTRITVLIIALVSRRVAERLNLDEPIDAGCYSVRAANWGRGLSKPDRSEQSDKAVGVQLQNLRVFQGLSRDDAARRLGISSSVIRGIENGDVRPQPALLLEMARVYEVPPSRVFDIAKITQAPDPGGR